jgi:hypothetical protein
METLENLLIGRGELSRIYTGQMRLFLWRALHRASTTANPLYPDFEPREIRAGVLRAPDVTVQIRGGTPFVIARLGEGTSLFDRAGAFGHENWTYFEIPKGTVIPDGLIIVKDDYNKKYKATHYSLSPNQDMTQMQFMQLLDQLARNAIQLAKKVGHGAG